MVDTTWSIDAKGNVVEVSGPLVARAFRPMLATLHRLIDKSGYQDVVLDFTKCTSVQAGQMLGICVQTYDYSRRGIEFDLRLPDKPQLASLFKNTNWAHLIDHQGFDPSEYQSPIRIPATRFEDADQQFAIGQRISSTLLKAVEVEPENFNAFDWAVNEITDNVINHSRSEYGGFVQVSLFKNRRQVQVTVADSGLGIPTTLRSGHEGLTSDVDALNSAIREGFTRDKSQGQGNGLYGCWQICMLCEGLFEIDSGYARVTQTTSGLWVSTESVPYSGTLVIAQMDYSQPHLLEEALRIAGGRLNNMDYVESHFEHPERDVYVVEIAQEARSYGSRQAGAELRHQIKNLLNRIPRLPVHVDFEGVSLVSSSFADEVFGKLFLEIGPMEFLEFMKFENCEVTVRQIIDRAIRQRSQIPHV